MAQKRTSKSSPPSPEEQSHLINQARAKVRDAWDKYQKVKTYENYQAFMGATKRYREIKLEHIKVVSHNVTPLFQKEKDNGN